VACPPLTVLLQSSLGWQYRRHACSRVWHPLSALSLYLAQQCHKVTHTQHGNDNMTRHKSVTQADRQTSSNNSQVKSPDQVLLWWLLWCWQLIYWCHQMLALIAAYGSWFHIYIDPRVVQLQQILWQQYWKMQTFGSIIHFKGHPREVGVVKLQLLLRPHHLGNFNKCRLIIVTERAQRIR